MRIDSSGNVGIGCSPPTGVRTKIKGLAEATNLATSATSAALFIEPYSGSSWGLGIGSISGQIQYIQGVAAAGDSARELSLQPFGGNVGIGTSSPTTFSGFLTVHQKNSSGDAIHLVESDGGIIAQTIANDASGVVTTGSRSNHPWRVTTNDIERLRIDSSGNVLVGKTVADDSTAGVRIGSTAGFMSMVRNSGRPLFI